MVGQGHRVFLRPAVGIQLGVAEMQRLLRLGVADLARAVVDGGSVMSVFSRSAAVDDRH